MVLALSIVISIGFSEILASPDHFKKAHPFSGTAVNSKIVPLL